MKRTRYVPINTEAKFLKQTTLLVPAWAARIVQTRLFTGLSTAVFQEGFPPRDRASQLPPSTHEWNPLPCAAHGHAVLKFHLWLLLVTEVTLRSQKCHVCSKFCKSTKRAEVTRIRQTYDRMCDTQLLETHGHHWRGSWGRTAASNPATCKLSFRHLSIDSGKLTGMQ